MSILRFFRRLGVVGIFLFSVLDSSFLMLPFGNDLLLIGLTSSDRNGWTWIAYVGEVALGSVLGVLLVDVLMRATGERGLRRFVSSTKLDQIKSKIEKK